MTHFTLPLHATREELIALAAGWAEDQALSISIERYFPSYAPAAIPLGDDPRPAIAAFEPVRRVCLRRGDFDVGATNEIEHLTRNPESFVMVLEPLTDDGLRATALTGRMGDEDALRWWIALVRETTAQLHQGAWAIEPASGTRQYVADHFHNRGAHDLAASGVPMLAATGPALFDFDDLA